MCYEYYEITQSRSLIWLCMKLPRTCLIWYYYFNEIESRELLAISIDISVNLTLRFYFCLIFRNRSYIYDHSTLYSSCTLSRLMLKLYITTNLFVFLLFSNFFIYFSTWSSTISIIFVVRTYSEILRVCTIMCKDLQLEQYICVDAHNTIYTFPNIDL